MRFTDGAAAPRRAADRPIPATPQPILDAVGDSIMSGTNERSASRRRGTASSQRGPVSENGRDLHGEDGLAPDAPATPAAAGLRRRHPRLRRRPRRRPRQRPPPGARRNPAPRAGQRPPPGARPKGHRRRAPAKGHRPAAPTPEATAPPAPTPEATALPTPTPAPEATAPLPPHARGHRPAPADTRARGHRPAPADTRARGHRPAPAEPRAPRGTGFRRPQPDAPPRPVSAPTP